MYSVFELCRIICSQIVLKDLDQEQKSGKNGGCASCKNLLLFKVMRL